jgi:hypothetical protein
MVQVNLKSLYLILFVLFLSVFKGHSQMSLDSINFKKYIQMLTDPKQDTSYIKQMDEKLSIAPIFIYKRYEFILTDQWQIGNPVIYMPNVSNRLGAKFRYKGLGLGITFQLPSNEFIYGKTKSIGLLLNGQFGMANWGTDFFFLRNRGHYIENAENVISGWKNGTPHPTRYDLRVTSLGINTYTVFSEYFSMKAAMHQTEKQMKSAGGISLAGGFEYNHFRGDSSVVPPSQFRFYEDIDSLSAASFLTVSLAPGFAYTYVYSDVFLTGMVHLGAGAQIQARKMEGKDGPISPGASLLGYINYRFIGGYNGDTFYGNVAITRRINKAFIKDSAFRFAQSGVTMTVGMRFN